MADKFDTVDGYIESFPPEVQVILEEIRRRIHVAAPGTEEKISYQIPTVTLDDKYLVYFAGWKRHVSLYPISTLDEPLEDEVAVYRSGKDTLQFPLNEPVPYDLIERIVGELVEKRRRAAER
jgi:uncharacterized protein YdhG (YjbR/CyaY superfamily)